MLILGLELATPILPIPESIRADIPMQLDWPVWSGEMPPVDHFILQSGKGRANRAFMARRLGHPVQLLGRCSGDMGEPALSFLRDAGSNLAALSPAAGQWTASPVTAIPPTGTNAVLLASHAKDTWVRPASHFPETDRGPQQADPTRKQIEILLPDLARGVRDQSA